MSVINCSCIGNMGRFGNQMFQYAYAKAYADKYGHQLHTPSWDGEKIFKITPNPITDTLPKTEKNQHVTHGKADIDIFGYFQETEHILTWFSKRKEIFQFQDHILDNFQPLSYPYMAIHLRRGDYKYLQDFPVISFNEYEKCIDIYGLRLPIAIITDGNPHYNEYYSSLGLDWLQDFMLLNKADVILTGNSTFSWLAAVLSKALDEDEVFSPRNYNGIIQFNRGLFGTNIVCR